jgi:hypothetical protein
MRGKSVNIAQVLAARSVMGNGRRALCRRVAGRWAERATVATGTLR